MEEKTLFLARDTGDAGGDDDYLRLLRHHFRNTDGDDDDEVFQQLQPRSCCTLRSFERRTGDDVPARTGDEVPSFPNRLRCC